MLLLMNMLKVSLEWDVKFIPLKNGRKTLRQSLILIIALKKEGRFTDAISV